METKEKSGFVKIKCHECGNEQVIFGRASTEVKCTKEGEKLQLKQKY